MNQKILPFLRSPKVSVEGLFETGEAGVIELYNKNSYGRSWWYVKDPVKAAALFDLTGKPTVSPVFMNALKALGFTLKQVEAPQEKP